MVVVKAGAIAEDQVAFDFDKAELALGVLSKVISFVGILPKFRHTKPADIRMWIFGLIIPTHPNPRLSRTANQRNGFRDDVEFLVRIPKDTDFRFEAELDDGTQRIRRCGRYSPVCGDGLVPSE